MDAKWFWGIVTVAAVAVAILLFAPPCLSDPLERIFTTLQPVATIFIGAVVAIIAFRNYSQTRGSKFVIHYAVSLYGETPQWGSTPTPSPPYEGNDIVTRPMPFVAKIYIRNEKNKVEAIEKISLQIRNKVIIPLASYDNKPLLIEPFNHVIENLYPVTFYHKEDDKTQNPYVLDWNDGENILYDKRNKIIIQTQEGQFFVKANIKPKNFKFKYSTVLTHVTERDTYGTIVSYEIKNYFYKELYEKPQRKDIPINMDEEISEAKKIGIQFFEARNRDGYQAEYYFLSEDNRKFSFRIPPAWWKNCLENYKMNLKNPYQMDSLKNLNNFLSLYLQAKEIDAFFAGELIFPNPNPPNTIQDLLIEKKLSLKSRLGRFFLWKKKRTKCKAQKQKK